MGSDGAMTLAGKIVVNTNVSAAAAAVTAVVYTGIRNKRADIPLTLNAVVAGLVSITAGCDAVTPSGAILIGMGAGILSIAAMEFIEKRIKVDDPVGAVSVHGVCGFYGTVMVGLLSAKEGLLYAGDFRLLVTQLVGVCCVSAFVFAVTAVVFWLIKIIFGLRVSGKAEQEGLDKAEHGLVVADPLRDLDLSEVGNAVPNLEVYAEKIPPFAPSLHKLTKVTIVINRDRFEALKAAMNSIGVTGMTVANVFGCGVQKGMPETYRGVELPMRLLPKVQVDIVVTKVPVEDVVSVAEQVLRTGHIGDGKIFISDIQNVVKVRTGERDYDALQGLG